MIIEIEYTDNELVVMNKLKECKTFKQAVNKARELQLELSERMDGSQMVEFDSGHHVLIKKLGKEFKLLKYNMYKQTGDEWVRQQERLRTIPMCYGKTIK